MTNTLITNIIITKTNSHCKSHFLSGFFVGRNNPTRAGQYPCGVIFVTKYGVLTRKCESRQSTGVSTPYSVINPTSWGLNAVCDDPAER